VNGYEPPGWVPPERLPDDLPPQERWVAADWDVVGAPAAHPPWTAPGFERARRRGLLPEPPPIEPPTPLPGMSAGTMVALGALTFVSPLALVATLSGTSVFSYVTPPYGLLAFVVSLRLLRASRRRGTMENAAGYTTTLGSPGLWRLTPLGRPFREPDRRYLPDGFYPSPYWPGMLQKWEGRSWRPFVQYWWRDPDQWFRVPSVPYLEGPP
jgi:hypothetical protein